MKLATGFSLPVPSFPQGSSDIACTENIQLEQGLAVTNLN